MGNDRSADEHRHRQEGNDDVMGFFGNLSELQLADLIEMVSFGAKSGTLLIHGEHGSVVGELIFDDGLLAHAAVGTLRAEHAFYALLAFRQGAFSFDPDARPPIDTPRLQTPRLLMEGMRRLDEISRLRRRLPGNSVLNVGGTGSLEGIIECEIVDFVDSESRAVDSLLRYLMSAGYADEYECLRAICALLERGILIHTSQPE